MNILIIFYARVCQNDYYTFYDMTKTVFNQFQISVKEVKSVEVEDIRNYECIKQAAQANLNPSVTACVWILPGPKKNGTNYDKIKRMLINYLPVPSQMIISKTIGAGKNLRSIITKLYVQLCAKIGGIPWAIDNLPFSDKPSMVVGIDVYNKAALKTTIFSMVATMNPTFSAYWSNSSFSTAEHDLKEFLGDNIQKAIENFKRVNNILPVNIIVFREGISRGQVETTKATEVQTIKSVLDKFGESRPNLLFVSTNKTSNAKFFFNSSGGADLNRLQNPLQGTYIHKLVTDNPNEFYLLAQKTFRGLASPTSFLIIENEFTDKAKIPQETVKDLIAKLAFKLCFLYYNTTGAIKVPAPIHYAQKLSYLVGDKSVGNERIIPHQTLGQQNSLYFI